MFDILTTLFALLFAAAASIILVEVPYLIVEARKYRQRGIDKRDPVKRWTHVARVLTEVFFRIVIGSILIYAVIITAGL